MPDKLTTGTSRRMSRPSRAGHRHPWSNPSRIVQTIGTPVPGEH
jgi:hypothetical protein